MYVMTYVMCVCAVGNEINDFQTHGNRVYILKLCCVRFKKKFFL